MDAEPLALLWEATLAGSAAVLLVLGLRRPIRDRLGASAAYALWGCVPVALLAVLLPRGAEAPLGLPVAWQAVPVAMIEVASEARSGWHRREWLLAFWLAGALASMAVLGWRQWRFRRGLGALRLRQDGFYQSDSANSGLPAVAGVLRPRILLPADFEHRYTHQEQALVIAHERLHVRRGDLVANALSALLVCLFWFNPLLHLALRRFRLDQELACDERVIAHHPHARRQYGEAMLKTQFDPSPLPLGCHWQARHPLKERIDMLKRPTPSPLRWFSSLLLAVVVTATTGYLAWATQPSTAQEASPAPLAASGPLYSIEIRAGLDGRARSFKMHQHAGRPFAFHIDAEEGAPAWGGEFVLDPVPDPAQIRIGGTLQVDGRQVSNPRLVVGLGKPATIELGGGPEIALEFIVRLLEQGQAGTDGAPTKVAATQAPNVAQSSASVRQWSELQPPQYPVEAARQGVNGSVMLLVTVGADGSARDVQVEKSTPQGVFDAAAVEAARQWRFNPGMRDGQPVEGGQVRVPITFETHPQQADEGADASQG